MLYAVISDIHSNLEAFVAVLKEIDSLNVDEVVSLGDIVGYNANPNECIEIIKKRGIRSVAGNHDLRACGLKEPVDFNSIAREAILWTRKTLTEENRDFLKNLPQTIFLHNNAGMLVHGSILNKTDTYILSPWIALQNFQRIEEDPSLPQICFFGHTHVRITYQYTGKRVLTLFDDTISLDDDSLYMINPGSVGQPRDRDPHASFLTYDTEERVIQFHRIPYDIGTTYRKIIEAGLPVELGERLKIGW